MPALPPIDEFRRPFVEPLGHLVLQAAAADNALIDLCTLVECQEPGALTSTGVAAKLRNWTDAAKIYAEQTIGAILDENNRALALDALARYSSLREQRHRAIHDAVEVGIFGSEAEGYEARPLRVGFTKSGRASTFEVVEVSPEAIAKLALDYHQLRADLESAAYQLECQFDGPQKAV